MNKSIYKSLISWSQENEACKVSILSEAEVKKEFGNHRELTNEGWHSAADSTNDLVVKIKTTYDLISSKAKEIASLIGGKVVGTDRDEFEDIGVAFIRLKGGINNG